MHFLRKGTDSVVKVISIQRQLHGTECKVQNWPYKASQTQSTQREISLTAVQTSTSRCCTRNMKKSIWPHPNLLQQQLQKNLSNYVIIQNKNVPVKALTEIYYRNMQQNRSKDIHQDNYNGENKTCNYSYINLQESMKGTTTINKTTTTIANEISRESIPVTGIREIRAGRIQ